MHKRVAHIVDEFVLKKKKILLTISHGLFIPLGPGDAVVDQTDMVSAAQETLVQ